MAKKITRKKKDSPDQSDVRLNEVAADNNLREIIERYEYVTRATSDAIWDYDIANGTLFWGEGFSTLFGHSPGDLRNNYKRWQKNIHPEDTDRVMQQVDEALNGTDTTWKQEYRFRKADGNYAWVVDKVYILRNKSGQPYRIIGAMSDVSVQKKIEDQKKLLSEIGLIFNKGVSLVQSLEEVLEHVTSIGGFSFGEIWLPEANMEHIRKVAFYDHDKHGAQFSKLSREMSRFNFGKGLPGYVWKNKSAQLWERVDRKRIFLRRKFAEEAGIRSALGIPLRHKEEIAGVLVIGSNTSDHNFENYAQFLSDLEDYLGLEIYRKQIERQLHNLFEYAPDILAIAGPDGYFLKVNPAFEELMGYSAEELTSRPFSDFLHPDDQNRTESEYLETISGSRTASNFINRYITKSGEERWISWSSSDLIREEGLAYAYGRDITDVKNLQDLYEKASELARIGNWSVDLIENKMYWSPVTYKIHEAPPDYNPVVDEGIQFYKEGPSRETIIHAFDEAVKSGKSWDLELQIVTVKGNDRWVRTIGNVEFGDNGKPVRLYGSFQDIHRVKSMEIALKSALAERDTILESIGDGFFAVDHKFTVRYWNRKAEKLLRVKRDQILGKNLWDIFTDATELPSYTNYNKAMQEKEVVHFEDYYEKIDSWFEVSAYPSQAGLSVYFKDISQRKRAEIHLLSKTRQLNAIASISSTLLDFEHWFEALHTSFGMIADAIDLDRIRFYEIREDSETGSSSADQVLEWNRGSLRPDAGNGEPGNYGIPLDAFGRLMETLTGGNYAVLSPSAMKDSLFRSRLVTQGVQSAVVFPVLIEKQLKSFISFEDCTIARFWSPEELSFLNSVVSNLTTAIGSAETQKELKMANERHQQLLDRYIKVSQATNDAIWDWDLLNQTILWGDGFKTLFGYETVDTSNILESWVGRIHPEDQKRVIDSFYAAIGNPDSANWQAEYRYRRSDGSFAFVIDRGIIIRNGKDRAVRMVGAITDITYRHEYEESLRRLNENLEKHTRELEFSNAELEQFAYVASHDLQEPLRMVTSFMARLEKKYAGQLDEKALEYIGFATDGARRMRQIILDLLQFSQVGRFEKEFEQVDLNVLINDYLLLRNSQIAEKSARIEFGKLPVLTGFRAPITQVFHNLLDNALKYSHEGTPPEIRISAEKLENEWKFEISDNGIGIDPEYFEKIFVIFQRLHTHEKYSGSGIGLAIVKKIINFMGGSIGVESLPGHGSTFWFTIPFAASVKPAP